MSKLEDIEVQIQELFPEGLKAFREWFTISKADVWHVAFEADVMPGKLDAMAERALREHHAGRSTKL